MARSLVSLLLWCTLAACRPGLTLTPCGDDRDCPPPARCDRAHGYCALPRPGDPICDRLHLRIDDLARAEGKPVQLVVRTEGDLAILARLQLTVQGGRVDAVQPFVVRQGWRYLVDAFLDVDDNQSCGAGDWVWRTPVQAGVCPARAEAGDPLGRPQDRCGPFGHTGDFDGDGCVDDADLDRLLADYGLHGDLVTDLDGDGEVGLSDLTLLLASYCAGEPDCCEVPDAGVPYQIPNTLRGDTDCDGFVNHFDVEAFAFCRDDPAGFVLQHPSCSRVNCDVDCSGEIDDQDLARLMGCYEAQICLCP